MNCFEKYLVELLQGKIIYNNQTVEVRKQFTNTPRLPYIYLDLSPGVTTNYSYHDVDGESDVLYFNRSSNINIHVWCNTEEERESITTQILECYYREKTNHYEYCTNYHEGNCTTGGKCKVSTVNNSRTVKDKCPDPDLYNYQSLQEKHHIIPGTMSIDPPFDMDDDTQHPPLLRSIIRAKADYFEPVLTHGVRVEEIQMGSVDIE